MSDEPSTSLRIDQPFKCEYAKSARAACRGCQEKIQKEELRLAKMVKNPRFDGVSPYWYHFDCFFEKNKPKSTGDMGHFSSLRYEDQKKIESKIGKAASQACVPSDFAIEYSKSGRASCVLCEGKIPLEELRIAKYDEESDIAQKLGKPIPRWFHVDCFVSSRQENGFFESAEKLPGFEGLEKEDRLMLKKKLPKMAAKRKAENKSDSKVETKKSKSEVLFEKKLEEQSKLIYSFIDQLKNMNIKDVDYLLEYNGYHLSKDRSKRTEQLADAMAFGALEKCPECKNGQLYFRIAGYICHGMVSDALKCVYETRKPKRKPFKVPDELKEKYDWLDKYKYKPRERIMPKVQGPVDAIDIVQAVTDAINDSQPSTSNGNNGENTSGPSIDPNKPLSGHKIVIFGKLNLSSKEVKKAITNLGGKVVPNFERTVLFGITSQKEVDKDTDKVDLARQYNIVLVDDNVVEDLKSNDKVEDIPSIIFKHAICNWGVSEVEKRFVTLIDKDKVKSFKSGSGIGNLKSKSTVFPDKQKLIIKGGAAVDPQSGLEDMAEVYREGKLIYSVVLNRVDVSANKNSYYKLQLLKEERSKSRYWVFTAWGRIGTNVGDSKLEDFRSLENAKQRFLTVFREKTGNDWSNRDNFVRNPSLYFPLEISYAGGDDDQKQVKMEMGKSELPLALQKLIMMLFDINLMQKEMKEFELDMTKMPLGKISKKQILEAYEALKEISQCLDDNSRKAKTKLVAQTERFFTLVPHSFGTDKLPVFSSKEQVEQKREMLDALMDMEAACEMMVAVKQEKQTDDPIKQHYMHLNADLDVVDTKESDYKMIEEYVENTHAPTHRQYKLKILDVFRVSRHGEKERYEEKYAKLHNKMLLWHGSRITNFANILAQGLRIAPPEAPVTGYMFGKGIYFADMVSKSANYCFSQLNNNIGLLALNEVALGDMWELKNATYVEKLPADKHSVKGLGRTVPDPKKNKSFEKDIIVPSGPAKTTNTKDTSLLYNEYIVYDTAQTKIRYLVMVEFDYKI